MIQKKTLLVQSASRSLIPFAIGSTSYLLKGLYSEENSLLNQISDLSFGVYTNYFGFLLVMLLIDLIFRVVQKSRVTPSSLDLEHQQEVQKLGSFNEMLKSLAASIISYSVIFAAYYLIALMIFAGSGASAAPSIKISEPVLNQFNAPRILEEKAPTAPKAPVAQSPVPEKISLSIGSVLSSLNIDVTAMVLSKDKKIAFTTVSYYGTLKIIDISNQNYPSVISSLALKQTGPVFKIKTLALSSDEKTLYVSNSRDFEIIDVSNLESPKLLSFTKSIIFDDIEFLQTAGNFRTSLAIDETTQTAFIGGLGMQVFDIINPQRPALLVAKKNWIGSDGKMQRSELCLAQEKKILFEANGTLNAYDVSNPREIKLVSSFEPSSAARSILLFEDSKRVYLLGNAPDSKLMLTEIDVSSPSSPALVNAYDTRLYITNSTGFLTASPNKTKFYFYADDGSKYSLFVFDTIQKRTSKDQALSNLVKNLVNNVYAMAFAHDGKTLIACSNDQFVIIDLPTNYPNSQTLGSPTGFLPFNLASSYQSMQLTPDNKILFVLRSVTQTASPRLYSVLEIYNIMSGDLLASYQGGQAFSQMTFANNYNTVYLLGRQELYVLDVTDRLSPRITQIYQTKDSNIVFSGFLSSCDGKAGFMSTRKGDNYEDARIIFFNLTKSSLIEGLYTTDKTFSVSNVKMVRGKTNTLFVIDREINIYDISNLAAPVLVSSLPIGDHEIAPFVSSALLSPDNTTLYLDTYDDNQFTSLKIYDVSNMKSPYLLSDYALPKFDSQSLRPSFSLSPDQRSGYVFQDNSLLKLDLSNLNSPFVSGAISISSNKTEKINNVIISDDGGIGVSVTDKTQVKIFSLVAAFSLYLKQEKFLLGQKYSDAVSFIIQSRTPFDYDFLDPSAYRIIKLSLVDIKIAPNSFTLQSMTSPLPSWITFDKQTNLLTVEPKNQAAIGSYAFKVAVAVTQITASAFDGVQGSSYSSEDILSQLISLGYVDNDGFLTANFKSLDAFLLPTKFASDKAKIYEILKYFYGETSTGFSVAPSLSLQKDKALAVSTLSSNNIVVDIKLYPYSTDSQIRFLSNNHDLVLTALSEAKSRMVLEGPLGDINTALRSIIVDSSNSTNYDAYIAISDGLNPAYTTYIANASQYFLQNSAPVMKGLSIQEQVERISIATGQYFNIHLDSNTFIDMNGNQLSYQLLMDDVDAEMPSWLVFEKLTLRGTAPEDFTGRSLRMVLVAQNEFKETRVPFTLNVKLTTMTVIKMAAKGAFILLMVVLAAVSILRCGGKKEYEEAPRESKEYLLRRNAENQGF